MLLITALFVWMHLMTIEGGSKGSSITCECSTQHCRYESSSHCNTTGLCFSQFIVSQRDINPLIKGCIKTRTHLLCENRRPAIGNRSWPLLVCCSGHLCNRDLVPTLPPWAASSAGQDDEASLSADQDALTDSPLAALHRKRQRLFLTRAETSSISPPPGGGAPVRLGVAKGVKEGPAFPHIVSPVYISVLVLGVVSLVVIGVVAAVVLRKSDSRPYPEEYGALEHQHCLKHGSVAVPCEHDRQCDCDPSRESPRTRKYFVPVVYSSHETEDT